MLFFAFVSVEKKFPIRFGKMQNKIMRMSLRLWLSATLILKIGFITAAEQDCHGEYSVSDMFLRGHTFKTVAVDFPSKCHMLCNQDIRCQSYNVIIGRHICELNNRTKEARPGDFLLDSQRFYMRRAINRVPLGSVPELPAKSCAEIKASEGKEMADSKHWIYSNGDDAIHATCRDIWQKINSDPVCFGAKNDHYGSFNVTKTGFVKYLKLVHRTGSIRCNPTTIATYWSCSNTNYYASNTFMTIITNANRQALLPSEKKLKASGRCNLKKHFYVMDGVNQATSELLLGNPSSPLRLLKDQELQIWYGQDWIDCSEDGNSGST